MWDATTYLKEARDAHGRWISGAAALGDAIDKLQKSGDIDKATAQAVSSAIARHGEMGRGLPKDADGDHAKTLAYLSQTVKHDALTYRHQNPPDISEAKKLDSAAHSIAKAHAKLSKVPIEPHADSPYRLTPDSQPLDGPSGPVKIKGFVKEDVSKLKHGDIVRVTGKDGVVRERTVYRAAPNNDKSKIVVRFKDKVDGQPNSISVEHGTRLSTVGYDNPHQSHAPTPVSAPSSTAPVSEPKVATPAPQTPAEPKVVKPASQMPGATLPDDPNHFAVGEKVSFQHGMLGKMNATVTKVANGKIHIAYQLDDGPSSTALTINQAAVKLEHGPMNKWQPSSVLNKLTPEDIAKQEADAAEHAAHPYHHELIKDDKTTGLKAWQLVKPKTWPEKNEFDNKVKALMAKAVTGKPLTGAQKDAVGHYTDDAIAKRVNSELRKANPDMSKNAGNLSTGHPSGAKVGEIVKQTDAAIAQSKTTEPLVVFRGYGIGMDFKPGDTISDKAFVSTTLNKSMAEDRYGDIPGATVAEIHIPAGSHALARANALHHDIANELILPRGSTFKVESASDGHAILTLVPPVSKPDEVVSTPDSLDNAAGVHAEVPATPEPVGASAADITMHEKPKITAVNDLKRGDIIEVNTSQGTFQRTLDRSPKWNTPKTMRVVTFSDDKSEHGLKKNLSYDPSATVKVLGRDESYKAQFKKSGAPTVKAEPEPKVVKPAEEPKVVKPAAEVHAEAEPKVVKKAEPTAEITSPVSSPKLKIATKLKNAVKTVKKMETVSVNGANLQVGDVIQDGKLKIPTGETKVKKSKSYWAHYNNVVPVYKTVPVKRTIIAVERDDKGNVTDYTVGPIDSETRSLIDNAPGHVKYASAGSSKFYHFFQSTDDQLSHDTRRASGGTGQTHLVTRLVESTSGTGKKLKAHEQPTGDDLRSELQQALDSGEPLDEKYDPTLRPMPSGHKVGHVQSLLYDLAVGKQNGVSGGNVKTDGEYKRELEASGEAQRVRDEVNADHPYIMPRAMLPGFKEQGDTNSYTPATVTLPHTASDEEIAALQTAMSARSATQPLAAAKRQPFIDNWMATHNGEAPSIHDFAKSLEPADYASQLKIDPAAYSPNGQRPIDRNVKVPRERMVKPLVNAKIKELIAQRREAEHTTARDFELPTWDSVHMEPQNLNDIQQRVEEEAKPKTIERPALIGERIKRLASMFPPGKQNENTTLSNFMLTKMSPENAKQFASEASAISPEEPIATVDQKIGGLIDKYKNPGASVPAGFEEMLRENYSQSDWNDISSALDGQAAFDASQKITYSTHEYTPSFVTAGLADDGVLYHRLNESDNTANLTKAFRKELHANSFGLTKAPDGTDLADMLTNGTDGNLDKIAENVKAHVPGSFTQEYLLNLVDKARENPSTGEHETKTHISAGSANLQMMKVMAKLNALEMNDNESSAAQRTRMHLDNKGTWGLLVNGKKLMAVEGGEPLSDEERMAEYERAFSQMGEDGKYNGLSSAKMPPPLNGLSPNVSYDEASRVQQQYDDAKTIAEKRAAVDEFAKLAAKLPDSDSLTPVMRAWAPRAHRALNEAELARKSTPGNPVRRIEYTPQTQGPDMPRLKTGSSSVRLIVPRNQRGRLSLYGYTPAEAHAKLRELGIIGEPEPNIPADQIFRGPRRKGIVSPLLADYVRGDAPVPNTDWLASHGLTDNRGIGGFESIFRSGGMMGIQERQNRGIRTDTTSQVGDIGSGIDNVTFSTLGSGGAVGGGSNIRLVLKPHNLIRRDVIVSPTDYGGGEDRNAKYNRYRDEMEVKAGLEVGKTKLFDPLAPGARQAHLDDMGAIAGDEGPRQSDEYDIAGQITADDVHTVIVGDESMVPKMKAMFARLKAEGLISRIPAVTTSEHRGAAARGEIEPSDQPMTDTVQTPINAGLNETQKAGMAGIAEKIKEVGGAQNLTPFELEVITETANLNGISAQVQKMLIDNAVVAPQEAVSNA